MALLSQQDNIVLFLVLCTYILTYVSFRKLNSDPSEVKNGVYQCPNCGHEDHSLAQWRRLQSSQEKWDEGLMRWYQKKKCERKCVAEVFLTSLNNNLSIWALPLGNIKCNLYVHWLRLYIIFLQNAFYTNSFKAPVPDFPPFSQH